jgi:hypothetical protein
MNWNLIVQKVGLSTVQSFVNKEMSLRNFYDLCKQNSIGPEGRKLSLMGADRARKAAREAVRRRTTVTVSTIVTV